MVSNHSNIFFSKKINFVSISMFSHSKLAHVAFPFPYFRCNIKKYLDVRRSCFLSLVRIIYVNMHFIHHNVDQMVFRAFVLVSLYCRVIGLGSSDSNPVGFEITNEILSDISLILSQDIQSFL